MDFGDIIVLETEAARRVRDERRIHRRNLRDRSNPFDLGDEEFRIYFRILAAVRFYAVGSYQRCVGQDYNIVLAQRTVSKVVKEVSHAIVHRLLNVYIKFSSTTEERRAVASGFQAAHGLPDCLGCIDCTHIAIVTPHNNDANDPPIGLLNVNARFPGSTHDQHIFNRSVVKDEMMRLVDGRIRKYYLIGDSGYSKQSYMLTPVLPSPPEGSPEYRYPLPEPETSTEELTDHSIPTHTATSSSAALRWQQDIIMLIN
ncbi:unnamed protein product [Danaus chrysippus]|uniref:(African queen) hypothetical protein n=1 Tax=Danaus chrysippus TaxID=151541 RepID=A0A8J2VX79_9NEOP|nr:unnamed protein product [Danaus chrysippus]